MADSRTVQAKVLSKCVNEIHVSGSRYPKPLRRDSLVSADFRRKILINGAKSGLIDFQTVLDAERSVLSFQDQLAQSKGQVTSNVISLYKALGGGWTAMTGMPP